MFADAVQKQTHKHRRLYWAPGNYMCKCRCGAEFIGDKRAVMCPTCAYDPMVVIAMNGPPGCGKDYLAEKIMEHFANRDVNLCSFTFAEPIHCDLEQIYPFWREVWTQELKNIPCDRLGGRTPREVLIEYATEQRAIYNNCFLDRTLQEAERVSADMCILTDLGYEHEREFLNNYKGQVIIVSIDSEGCNYDNDNRGYQRISGKTIVHRNVKNNVECTQNLLETLSTAVWQGGLVGG